MSLAILSKDPDSILTSLEDAKEFDYEDKVHGRIVTVTRYKYMHKQKRNYDNKNLIVNKDGTETLKRDWLRKYEGELK